MKIAVSPDSLCGGVPVTPSQTFFTVNGKPVVRSNDVVPPHPGHTMQTIQVSRFFTCEGISVATLGDAATCTDLITTGEYVNVDG